MEWYLKVLKQFADFKSRSRRKEYWMFTLFNFIFTMVAAFLDGGLGLSILYPLYSLVVFVPSLAVSVRRLHDVGKSGWWLLIALTGIGVFYLLYLFVTDGEAGDNQFGSNPKGALA